MAETIKKKTCRACGHKWYPKSPNPPKRCANPLCRTLCWEREPLKKSGNFSRHKNPQEQDELIL